MKKKSKQAGPSLAAELPKRAKKTGRRGPRPLDPVADFEEPVTREPEQLTAADLEADQPPAPEQVENGMALMQFVRAKLTRDRTKARFIEMELSVGLTDNSAPLFGREIEGRYAILSDDAGVTSLSISDVSAHTIDIAMAPAAAEFVVHAVIQPQKVNLHAVQEKGSGEERTVIRLSFVAPIAQTKELLEWAGNTHGELVWVRMGETQGKLV